MIYKLLRATEEKAREIAVKELRENGYEPVVTEDFIFATGTVPVLLVAHYDTVLKEPPKKISRKDNVLSSSKGLGADDRAGMYAVLQTIRKHHCHVLFTGGEEIGCVGAEAFVNSDLIDAPIPVNYIIELDRRGDNDAVFYDGANKEFEEFITSHGWETAEGTFTDICVLAPAIGVAAVNLSIGYQNEHRENETLGLTVMNKTISRLPALLDHEEAFEWIEKPYSWRSYYRGGYADYDDMYYYNGHKDPYDDYTPYARELVSFVVEYTDNKNRRRLDLCEGANEYEALGMFFVDHPDVCYSQVTDVFDESEWR